MTAGPACTAVAEMCPLGRIGLYNRSNLLPGEMRHGEQDPSAFGHSRRAGDRPDPGPETTMSQLVTVRHASGQSVAPVYEGFDLNADGSYNMWFGYMNRNYEEAIDLPVGSNNTFEPGGDRGQPTHFTPRRHKDIFKVVVPKDFGDQQLTWKLTSHGQTQQVIAHAEAGLADRSRAHDARRQQRERSARTCRPS